MGRELTPAILADSIEVRIVFPFMKEGALERLLSHRRVTALQRTPFRKGVRDGQSENCGYGL